MQTKNRVSLRPSFWLVKFAPFRTSWTEIVKRGTFTLRGVRSPAARKHLSKMRLGDAVLYYHSQQELAVVGVMEVTREAFPTPQVLILTGSRATSRRFGHWIAPYH